VVLESVCLEAMGGREGGGEGGNEVEGRRDA
jgi:hypothetical protein